MSAFVCVFDRSGETVDRRQLRRLAEPLAAYGSETSIFCRGALGLAVRHRGGRDALRRYGPVADRDSGRVAAVVGRFSAVKRVEGGPPGGGREVGAGSAAAALLWPLGELSAALAGLEGSFVAVVADPRAGRVDLVRDHLGDRKLYYLLDRHRLIASSEAAAIVRHAAVSADPDATSAARFLGFRFGPTERSFFRGIGELPAAHHLAVTAETSRARSYWRFRRHPSGAPSAGEASALLRRALRRAVAAASDDLEPERLGLSLSGGLDSTALAAVAPRGVRALSWRFERAPDLVEERRIEAVARHLGLSLEWVRGDGLHPLCEGFTERFVHASSPYVNPFSALKCRLYRAAAAAGCERIVVGDSGDALYAASDYWLADLIADRGPGTIRSLLGTLGRAARGDRFARSTLSRLRPSRRRGWRLPASTPWLTPTARAALPEEGPSPIVPPGGDADRHERMVGTRHTELESEERRLFDLCGVSRANPYRSWPLLEWAIQLRAYRLHRDGRFKVLPREAFAGRLPGEVLRGARSGLLGDLFLRGIESRREELADLLYRRPRSDWQRYVRREWLERYLAGSRSIAFGHTILWRVLCFELWHRCWSGES